MTEKNVWVVVYTKDQLPLEVWGVYASKQRAQKGYRALLDEIAEDAGWLFNHPDDDEEFYEELQNEIDEDLLISIKERSVF